MEESNPVLAKWREIVGKLAKIRRKLESLQRRHDELQKKEIMFRETLMESGVSVPEVDQLNLEKRRVTPRSGVEIDILRVTKLGEVVRAEDVIGRLKEVGVELASKNPSAAVRTAMRRSDSFVSAGRGKFKRAVVRGSLPDPNAETPPPDGKSGNGAYSSDQLLT